MRIRNMNYYQEPELTRDYKEEYYVRSHILSRIIIILLVVSTAISLVFLTPVYAQNPNQEEDNISLNFSSAVLKDYSTREEVDFSKDHSVYILQTSEDETLCSLTEGYTLKEDFHDENLVLHEDGFYHVDSSGIAFILRINAPDGKSVGNFYFILQDNEGKIPLEGQTDETIEQANLMLTGWRGRSEKAMKTLNTIKYWDTFMATATDVDIRDAFAYDVTKHTMNYPSDWAGCVIELIMTGRNPYNHNGINYVENMKKRGSSGNYGPYANNTWALIVLRMCGEEIPDNLVGLVKNMAKDKNGGDIRPWALAALSDWDDPRISQEELVAMALEMKGTLQSDGLWGNAYTNGCYLTGIAASGVNIDYFSTDGDSFLKKYANKYMTKDYKFIYGGQADSYVKDAIIGLGDLIHERSIWASYALTPEKLEELISKANLINTDKATEEEKSALSSAIEMAEAVSGNKYGFGQAYYELYEAMGRIDDTYNFHVRFCNEEQIQQLDEISQVLGTFSSEKIRFESVPRIQAAWSFYQSFLSDSNLELAGYVDQPARFGPIIEEMISVIDDRIAELDKLTSHGTTFNDTTSGQFAVLKSIVEALDSDQANKLTNHAAYSAMLTGYRNYSNQVIHPEEKINVVIKEGIYKITSSSAKTGTASLIGTKKKTIKKLVIPSYITSGGKKYKVISIGANALKGRKKLAAVTIGKNVTGIGKQAFYGCSKLKKITVKGTLLKKVGKNALKGIHKKAVIKVPKKKKKTYQKLFKSKGQNKNVRIS